MPSSPYQQGTFCWHEIATPNAPAAKAFYSSLIGYSADDREMAGGGGTYTMLGANGGHVAGLYELNEAFTPGVPPHWMSYIWVDDVDASAARAKELGGTVTSEPFDVAGVGRIAIVRDPTGAVVGLYHGSEHLGAAHVGPTQGTVDWNELMTTDAALAEAFYTNLFGWTPDRQDMGGTAYVVFRQGEEPKAGMMQMGPEFGSIPSHWMPYVTVDNADEAVEKAKSLGAKIEVPPRDVEGIGRFSVLQDPTGAHFSIMHYTVPQ
jgi:predicted enzyme related to lactoylglutathione lyase